MTEAADTGGIALIETATPRVDALVTILADSVWPLVRADQMAAAIVLLQAKTPAFLRAWRDEYVGIATAPEAPPKPATGCISMDHTSVDCAAALAAGVLPETVPFCPFCSEQQMRQTPAPTTATETGRVVHIITNTGKTTRKQRTKVG